MPDENYVQNPKLFREMSEPFPTQEEANAAIAAFWQDVLAAREKHRIATGYLVMSWFVGADGEETSRRSAGAGFGDELLHLPLMAQHFGVLQAQYEDRIGKLITGKNERKQKGQ